MLEGLKSSVFIKAIGGRGSRAGWGAAPRICLPTSTRPGEAQSHSLPPVLVNTTLEPLLGGVLRGVFSNEGRTLKVHLNGD